MAKAKTNKSASKQNETDAKQDYKTPKKVAPSKNDFSFDDAIKGIGDHFTELTKTEQYDKLNAALVKLGLLDGAWNDIVDKDDEFIKARRNGMMPETVQPRYVKSEAINVRKAIASAKKGKL